MEVVCLQEEAFYKLFEKVVDHLKQNQKEAIEPFKWINGDEAMRLLNITSKTTLQKLRNEGKIRFSQPQKRVIVYDRDSINDYLEQYARDTF